MSELRPLTSAYHRHLIAKNITLRALEVLKRLVFSSRELSVAFYRFMQHDVVKYHEGTIIFKNRLFRYNAKFNINTCLWMIPFIQKLKGDLSEICDQRFLVKHVFHSNDVITGLELTELFFYPIKGSRRLKFEIKPSLYKSLRALIPRFNTFCIKFQDYFGQYRYIDQLLVTSNDNLTLERQLTVVADKDNDMCSTCYTHILDLFKAEIKHIHRFCIVLREYSVPHLSRSKEFVQRLDSFSLSFENIVLVVITSLCSNPRPLDFWKSVLDIHDKFIDILGEIPEHIKVQAHLVVHTDWYKKTLSCPDIDIQFFPKDQFVITYDKFVWKAKPTNLQKRLKENVDFSIECRSRFDKFF